MGRLYVRCKTCGIWFNTGIEAEVVNQVLVGKRHKCPMGHENLYSPQDYRDEGFFERRQRRVAGRLVNF